MRTCVMAGRDVRVGVALAVAFAAGLAAPGAMAQPDLHRSAEPVARFDGQRIVRLWPQQGVTLPKQMQIAEALSEEIWTHTPRMGEPVDVRVTPEQLAAIITAGIPHVVLVQNVQAQLEREMAEVWAGELPVDDDAWYTSYKNLANVRTYVQQLQAQFPNLAQNVVIGQSHQGRDIFGLRITGPGNSATRPQVLFHGCQHAREWVTVPTNVYIAERLLTLYGTDPVVTDLLNNLEVFVVPVFNPDGYEYTWTTNRLWRKNRQPNAGSNCVGTDNNRNWGFQWGGQGASTNPCSDTFRGSAAFSGTETAVFRDFALANPRLAAHIDFHSFSQLIMWPWGWTATLNPDNARFNTVGQAMETAIESAFGVPYTRGPIYTTIYPASGGSCDWMYGARQILSYTIELRDTGQFGFELPAAQILPTAQENWRGALELMKAVRPAQGACYANCDGSTGAPSLTPADFVCFLDRYRAGNSYANCDGSTGSPALTPADFVCFLNTFRAGC